LSRRVLIETYGCQMNVADSELVQGVLRDAAFEAATALDDADVILLNTCAVREKAEERIFGRLTNLIPYKRRNPHVRIGVLGCMAERLGEEIRTKAPYVDFIVGPDAYRRLPEIIAAAQHDPVVDVALDKGEVYQGIAPARPSGVNAWLTISRGCDHFCAFCIVPFVRGRERAVPAEEILTQARDLVEGGSTSLTLLGQTVNTYRDGDTDFVALLRALVELDGLQRLRFASPHPKGFGPDLIELIAAEPKICNFVHLPLQSASDPILRAMRRGHSVAEYVAIVEALRRAVPGIAISTDIIVGFPGESQADYEATREMMRALRFDFAFMFAYSERDGTIAAKRLTDDVPAEVKQARLAEIIEIQQQISGEIFQSHIGRRVEVLVEGVPRRNPEALVGNSDDFKTTMFPAEGYKPGDLVEVEVLAATSQTLRGKAVRLVAPARVPIQVQDPRDIGISIGAFVPQT